MKNLNWLKFEEGIFEVKCNTEEIMIAFLVECEKRGYFWCSGDKPTHKNYYDGIPLYFDGKSKKLSYDTETDNEKEEQPYVIESLGEEQDKSGLSWREVFSNIQEGETYVWGNYGISLKNNKITIHRDDYVFTFVENQRFTKKEKQVEFSEAFQYMKFHGKTIKSCDSNCYYKFEGNRIVGSLKNDGKTVLSSLSSSEMLGKWIVLDYKK